MANDNNFNTPTQGNYPKNSNNRIFEIIKEIIDSLRRAEWCFGILGFGKIGSLYVNSNYANLFGSGCIIGAVLLAIWRIMVWHQERSFIPLADAIKKMAATGYYSKTKNLKKMWEKLKITQGSYYQNMLIPSIKNGDISLYGCGVFPPTKKHIIPLDDILENTFNEDFSLIVSSLGETMYKDLSLKK